MLDYVLISDCHLGSEFIQQDLLLKFLEKIRPLCRNLILVGDIFDFWREKSKLENISIFKRFVKVTYLPGNHDIEIQYASFLTKGIQRSAIVPIGEVNAFATHGDIFDKHFGSNILFYELLNKFIYYLSVKLNYDIRTKAQFLTEWFYQKNLETMQKVSENLIGSKYPIVIYGHTHCPGIQTLNGIQFHNLGSWFESPYCFCTQGDKYAYYEITESALLPEEKDFHSYRGH